MALDRPTPAVPPDVTAPAIDSIDTLSVAFTETVGAETLAKLSIEACVVSLMEA